MNKYNNQQEPEENEEQEQEQEDVEEEENEEEEQDDENVEEEEEQQQNNGSRHGSASQNQQPIKSDFQDQQREEEHRAKLKQEQENNEKLAKRAIRNYFNHINVSIRVAPFTGLLISNYSIAFFLTKKKSMKLRKNQTILKASLKFKTIKQLLSSIPNQMKVNSLFSLFDIFF